MNGRHPSGNMIRLTASFDRHCYCESMNGSFEPLAAGEPIGVVALSGPADPERLEAGLSVLRSWGREIVEAENLRTCTGYLAGDDEERLRGLQTLLDSGLRVILAARGGYGVTRILPRMPWRQMVASRVCVVGYSDLTAVLNPLTIRGGFVQVHGPVVSELGLSGDSAGRLKAVLEGDLVGGALFSFAASSVVRHGCVSGPALGGNLSLIAALAGTPDAIDFEGAVVFLEEVNEPLYRRDRLLTQIRASGMFRGVKALLSGNLQDCGPPQDEHWNRLLLECVAEKTPVVTDLPFGHGLGNLAFPIGARVTLDTRAGQVVWRD